MEMSVRTIPRFQSQKDERTFWEKSDACKYFDLSSAQRVVMPNLKLTTPTISLGIPQSAPHQLEASSKS